MRKAVLSEFVRFRKTARTTAMVLVGLGLLVTTFVFIGFDPGENGGGPGGGRNFGSVDLSAVGGNIEALSFVATFFGIAILAMFSLSVAREYELGTIRLLLVGQPRRAILLGGKLLALMLITVAAVVVATLGMVGLAYLLAPGNGVDTALWSTAEGWSAVWSALVNTALATTVWGLIGAAIAIATRSAAVSISVGAGYLLIGENLLGLLWDTASDWLPAGILSAFGSGGTEAVTYTKSVWLTALYALVCLTTLFVIMQRRDVTD